MDVKWIKITTGMFDDEKIKLIESMPDKDSILIIWIKLLILAGRINESGNIYLSTDMAYTDEMLATVFNRPLNTVRLALKIFQQYSMIQINDKGMHIVNWEKHQNIEGMERLRELTKTRVRNFRERKLLPKTTDNW